MSEKEIIYHYTNISGLNGIITSRNLWVSDCRYLNDKHELNTAIEIFLKRFTGIEAEALSLALDWHNSFRAHCVFSFSRSAKVLSQWRAYGDNGYGAAIGFNRKYLKSIDKTSSCALVDCIYEKHEEFITNLIDRYSKEIKELIRIFELSHKAVNTFWEMIEKTPEPLDLIYKELLKIKNPAFKEEQEVRLVISTPVSHVRTRVSNQLIIPYVEHNFAREDEKHIWCLAPEIWLGPKCDKRNMQSLRVFGQFGWNIKGIQHYDCGYI